MARMKILPTGTTVVVAVILVFLILLRIDVELYLRHLAKVMVGIM